MRRIVLAALLLAGCASYRTAIGGEYVPGHGVSAELAEELCGSEARFRAGVEQAKAAGGPLVPEPGDAGCYVIAHLGRPDAIRRVSTEGREAMHMHYSRRSVHHLVTLERRPEGWVVDTVVW